MKYVKKARTAGFLALSLLAFFFGEDQTEATTVNVIQYGAQADDNQPDTAAIQKAINIASQTGGIVDIPAGTFDIGIDASGNGIIIKSNVHLRMNDDTVLKMKPSNLQAYRLISAADIQNATITGGTLLGDRGAHMAGSGGWGRGIHIAGNASSIYVKDVTAKNFKGAGFTIENSFSAVKKVPNNVTLDRVTADHNGQQGLSIVAGRNITVINSLFKNTEGASPSAGIELKRNKPFNLPLENVVIRHNQIENNAGYGLIFSFSNNNRAEYNIIQSNKEGGALFRNAHSNTIHGNRISCNGRNFLQPYLSSGILINNGENNVISSNEISENVQRGIYALNHANGNHIISNRLLNNGHIGIETYGGTGLVIKNNYLSGSNRTITVSRASSSTVFNNGDSVLFASPAETPGPAVDLASPVSKEARGTRNIVDSLSPLKPSSADMFFQYP
ncbi:right-handed parallel beta-helix repeat-containing protein [Domibacillus robiginosus]|uniref:right-handed parallel beta-helix repeat-containing protein n=1 Tax=Domibacillus robiginosus TaxID=1071054 RepID=UPI00067D7A62|nr:right-handed parallel beta-helix repeat-containing protein [Domibacillus robiginosus]